MNLAHYHLLLNHFPIIGTILSFVILVVGTIIKNETVKKTAYWSFIVTGLLSFPAYFTGESAEYAIEGLPGVDKHLIHEHEEIAGLGLWLSITLGIAAFLALQFIQKSKANLINYFVLLFGLSVICLFTYIGYTGGIIRHPEIEHNLKQDKDFDLKEKIKDKD